MVDCATSYGTKGCNGGWMKYSYRYMTDNAIVTQEEYPYTAKDGSCQIASMNDNGVVKAKGYREIRLGDIKHHLFYLSRRPITIALTVCSNF